MPQAVALFSSEVLLALPWGHNLLLLEKLKDATTQRWYMRATLANPCRFTACGYRSGQPRHGQASLHYVNITRALKPASR